MNDMTVNPSALDVFAFKAPLKIPRRNAFGTMDARPALILKLTDTSGHVGWGEVFCNWPSFGFMHRMHVLRELLEPLIVGQSFESPKSMWQSLTDQTRLLVIQANEPGPFEQCIAGLDIAAWDMVARRADIPLYSLIAPDSSARVPIYASALTAETQANLVPSLRDEGWSGFKVKVGFGLDNDMRAVEQLRGLIPDKYLMLDANQSWVLDTARYQIKALQDFEPLWIEEPIATTASTNDWVALAHSSQVPLAAGENLRGKANFEHAVKDCGIVYMQPDAIKWGGVSGLIEVAENAITHGGKFAPHYLGSGVGLLVTAHIAQALGAVWMEVDVSENPLRSNICSQVQMYSNGWLELGDKPGIGLDKFDTLLADYWCDQLVPRPIRARSLVH